MFLSILKSYLYLQAPYYML